MSMIAEPHFIVASDDPSPVRSLNSSIRAFVQFSNAHKLPVHIYWINYKGQRQFFCCLPPEDHVDVSTFVTHPWVFETADSGDWLAGNRKRVYSPHSWLFELEKLRKFCPDLAREGVYVKPVSKVHIRYPVYSLKESSLQILRNNLKSDEDVGALTLPSALKDELLKLMRRKYCLTNHRVPCSECSPGTVIVQTSECSDLKIDEYRTTEFRLGLRPRENPA